MENITGIMIYYYIVCKRKLWYFANEIVMEQNSEFVSLGKALDEIPYSQEDKHIQIDGAINIDFISDGKKIHEVKKSKKIEEASVMQMKYYLYYLKQRGVNGVTGELDFPLLRQTVSISLGQENEERFEEICKEIPMIINHSLPPEKQKKAFCKSCAYYDMCYM